MRLPKALKNLSIKPELLFVGLASVFGLLFVFTVHPLFGNDEIVHFPRSYQISEGKLWTDHLNGYDYGGQLPVQVKTMNDRYREQVQSDKRDDAYLQTIQQQYDHETLTDTKREDLAFSSAAVYSPWSYGPQALGIATARSLHLPLNWFVYMGRLFNLITFIALGFVAIKYLPFGKLGLVVVALLPTSLTQAANLGMDGLVNGLSWLIIALTLAVFTGKLQLTRRLMIVLALASLYLATTKQAYGLIALLPLLIPARLYQLSYRNVWVWRLALGVVLLVSGLWYISYTSQIAQVIHFVQRPGLYVNEADQLHYVFQHPLLFMGMIFVQPFTVWSANVWGGIVGVITNRTIFLPFTVIFLLFGALGITLFAPARPHIAKRDRLFIIAASAAAFLGTFILINAGLYLSFTQVGYGHVEGLQGRYFLPLLPLLGVLLHLLLPKVMLRLPNRLITLLAYGAVLVGLVSATLVV